MGNWLGINNRINPTVFSDTKLSELISLPVDNLDDLINRVDLGEFVLWINPLIEGEDLENELSLFHKFIYRLLLFSRLILITGVSLYSIFTGNYWWLCLLPTVFALNWFRNYLIPFRIIINGLLIGLILSSFFIFQNESVSIIAAVLLLGFVWGLLIGDFERKQLLSTALNSEAKFIELYFRNVILVTRQNILLNSPEEQQSFVQYSNRHSPPKLTHQDRIFFCKQCSNRGFSKHEGIICEISGKKADFEFECSDFALIHRWKKKCIMNTPNATQFTLRPKNYPKPPRPS